MGMMIPLSTLNDWENLMRLRNPIWTNTAGSCMSSASKDSHGHHTVLNASEKAKEGESSNGKIFAAGWADEWSRKPEFAG